MSNRPKNTIVGHVRNGFLSRMMNYSPTAIVVWLALANRANDDGQCHPSIGTIQEDTGLARASIYKAIKELVSRGEMTVIPGGGKGNPSNHYQIVGSPQNELVQNMNQFKLETKVVHFVDKGSPQNELKPNNRTKHKNHTVVSTFSKPSLEEVTAFCLERKNKIDPQYFLDYYETRGWRLKGGQPMKDWRAAVRTWERNNFSGNGATATESKPKEKIVYRN